MPSQIKVDEIKNVAGQYEIKTDTFKGQSTAGSVAVQGEGTATTNLQQGLVKHWIHGATNGTFNEDSFNTTSTTDNGTGDTTATFTNNMANAHFAGAGLPGGDNTYGTSAQATSSHRTVIHRGDNISDNDSGNYSIVTVGELA